MLEADALTRRYGKVTAVTDVSFGINSNEVVGLLGHNGAGKTTIMRMLSGYLEPSAGRVRFNGTDLAENAHDIQQQLGYLPENLPIYPDMMLADYLDYAATVKGIEKRERYPAIREALAATELASRALDPINTFSRGLKQRVGVAQAILGRPRVLILDEPTNGLDPNQTDHMRQLIRQLARRASVILSTHIMQEVDAVCDRVLVLRNGRLVLDQSLAQLRSTRTLRLRTSAGREELPSLLRRMPQVVQLQRGPAREEWEEFTLLLHDNADLDRAASNIAHTVTEAGAKLYQLHPITRDLDSVFREVSARDQ
jgi:ABC-2 type transport system ATP-binding protein